jgi:hypothetical protein
MDIVEHYRLVAVIDRVQEWQVEEAQQNEHETQFSVKRH